MNAESGQEHARPTTCNHPDDLLRPTGDQVAEAYRESMGFTPGEVGLIEATALVLRRHDMVDLANRLLAGPHVHEQEEKEVVP